MQHHYFSRFATPYHTANLAGVTTKSLKYLHWTIFDLKSTFHGHVFRHFWTDERLTVAKKLTLNSVKGFWHPDTFVVNEKKVRLLSDPDGLYTALLYY
jgi:hypothetical protein